jgi:hypothetical protein
LKPEPRPPQWFRPARRTAAMKSCRPSTLRSLGQRVTQLSLARPRQAPLWNCCATASLMSERSQINSDTSSWSLPGLPLGTELTLRSRQPNGEHATSRRSVAVAVQPSQTDQNMALMTPDKASVVLSKPVVPSAVRHPPRGRREATGPAAQDLSGLRRKLFNHLVAPHH